MSVGDYRDLVIDQLAADEVNLIFTELSRRAALNLGEYPDAADRYLRLALKAQNQCRATLETLALIKSPPTVFARQANIAHGPQQVNNAGVGASIPRARAGDVENVRNELLEAHDERLDAGTTSATGEGDQALAPLGTLHRTAND